METSETAEGGRKHTRSHGNMVILHSNIRGYTSKKEAFYEVVKDIDADVCILNETGLKGEKKVNIPGYTT